MYGVCKRCIYTLQCYVWGVDIYVSMCTLYISSTCPWGHEEGMWRVYICMWYGYVAGTCTRHAGEHEYSIHILYMSLRAWGGYVEYTYHPCVLYTLYVSKECMSTLYISSTCPWGHEEVCGEYTHTTRCIRRYTYLQTSWGRVRGLYTSQVVCKICREVYISTTLQRARWYVYPYPRLLWVICRDV